MKVIVCGAGQVGANIARYLASEGNDVTVVDQSHALIQRLSDTLDVQAINGFASHPDVLEQAGAADAELLIAVTQSDEVNILACHIAHGLFNLPTRIARVRSQAYLQPRWAELFSREHIPIDVIISPEIEVARGIARRLQVPGAFDMIPFVDGRVRVIGVACGDDCPVVNTPLRHLTGLFPDLNIEILAIVHEGRAFIPDSDDQMFPGDEVYFVAESSHVPRAMIAFGHDEREVRRVLVLGGGNIGLFLAGEIEARYPRVSAQIIEKDPDRAERAVQRLRRTPVIHGDALDPDILREAGVENSEVVVAVTNSDETNILGSLLAKRHGCQRSVSLINSANYAPLLPNIGLDAVVSPRTVTISNILQHVRRGRIRAVHSLRDGFAEILDIEVMETSSLIKRPLRECRLPEGVLIGAIVRGRDVLIPRPSTMLLPGDRVVVVAAAGQVKKTEKLFSVRLEFF